MKKYKHIFFDLDRTLYDFDRSSYLTFEELYEVYELEKKGIKSFEKFFNTYMKINVELWEKYRRGEIEKAFLNVHRFHLTFMEFGIDDNTLAAKFANQYLALAPLKQTLFPGAIETLEYLKDKYVLHIITNGFEEVQAIKIKANGLKKYFQTITTSEEAGVKKPFEGIFRLAFEKSGAKAEESLMIGDDIEVDIVGAKNVGMDQMFFNNNGNSYNDEATYEIRDMKEIIGVL